MGNYVLRRFGSADILRSVAHGSLIEFLTPYSDYLAARGLEVTEGGTDADSFDFETLAVILAAPSEETPPKLIDALFYINEMATESGMESLLLELASQGTIINQPDPTPADVALRAWLLDPELVERCHGRQYVHKLRAFLTFYPDANPSETPKAANAFCLPAIEADLDDWFEKNKMGRHSKVFLLEGRRDLCFLIRRGEPFTRVPSILNGESSSQFFQPERHDVVIYKPETGELRVNAKTKGIRALYRQVIGKHLFGDAEYFPDNGRYTLTPLRTEGPLSLTCRDIPGITGIRLKEIQFDIGGAFNRTITIRSDDVFADLQSDPDLFPERGRISRASFGVRFMDSKRERTVVIKPDNTAKYSRDGDGDLIEQWMRARKFILEDEEMDEELLYGT